MLSLLKCISLIIREHTCFPWLLFMFTLRFTLFFMFTLRFSLLMHVTNQTWGLALLFIYFFSILNFVPHMFSLFIPKNPMHIRKMCTITNFLWVKKFHKNLMRKVFTKGFKGRSFSQGSSVKLFLVHSQRKKMRVLTNTLKYQNFPS